MNTFPIIIPLTILLLIVGFGYSIGVALDDSDCRFDQELKEIVNCSETRIFFDKLSLIILLPGSIVLILLLGYEIMFKREKINE